MFAPDISSADIQLQLDQILQQEAFEASATLSRFLRFVVQETLAGRASELKEFTIALGVLGRKPNFNPQQDPIVRIHAGRLRRALHQYYQGAGRQAQLVIDIPKGSYVPRFTRQPGATATPSETPAGSRQRLTIAVMPFVQYNANDELVVFADGLADHLSSELTRYSELSVISYFSCRNVAGQTADIREAGLLLDATYLLTGTVQHDAQRLRIRVQLTRADTREQIWANAYERKLTTTDLFAIQDDVVWQVVSQTAGHYGAISRHLARQPSATAPENPGIYNALFWYYRYVADSSENMFHTAEEAMRKAVEADKGYALGWAVLGEILIGGFFFGYTSRHCSPQLECAVQYGKQAIAADNTCQHGYQTIALARIFMRQHAEAMRTLAQWEKIVPHEAGIMGAMGFILICCGQYEKGFALLDNSIQLNPYYQWWYNAGFCFYHLHQHDYESVQYWAEKMNMPDSPWELLLKLAAGTALEQTEYCTAWRHEVLERFPFLQHQALPYIGAFLADDELVQSIYQALHPQPAL